MFLFVTLLTIGLILSYAITKIAWANIDRVERKQQTKLKQQEERNENE